jgi:hypothetical protein
MGRQFTAAEANALLPRLVPLVEQLMPAWTRLRAARREVEARIGERPDGDLGGGLLGQAAQDTITVQDAVAALQRLGAVVRDPGSGLLDFPAERQGERIYLCWRYPEPRVAFWHSVHAGYGGRQPLDAD